MRKPKFLVGVWGWWVGDVEVKLQEQTTSNISLIFLHLGYFEIMQFRTYLSSKHFFFQYSTFQQ